MKARKLFNILGLFLAVALGYFFFETVTLKLERKLIIPLD